MESTIKPLHLSSTEASVIEKKPSSDVLLPLQTCFLCDERFTLSTKISSEQNQSFLKHILEEHHLVIGDVESIASLPRYVQHWRPKLCKLQSLDAVCFTMKSNQSHAVSDAKPEEFFFLCSTVPEDRKIRLLVQRERLEEVLLYQQKEREDNSLTLSCLFCPECFTGNRSIVLNHMNEEHSFNIGHPDNLVFVEELLEGLRQQLARLLCLYCEKTFKDRSALKEHMRKKFHKRLNPNNKFYDKYYLVNYLNLNKPGIPPSASHRKEVKRGFSGAVAYVHYPGDSDGEEGSWQDWCSDAATSKETSVCLFCDHTSCNTALVFMHMGAEHDFDLEELRKKYSLSFYHQVKIINYVRRQIYRKTCLSCPETFYDTEALLEHATTAQHITSFLSDKTVWDQPEYYFPTFENDNLLSGLDMGKDVDLDTSEWVIPEKSLIQESEKNPDLELLAKEVTDKFERVVCKPVNSSS